jgi:hypothetical protein
MPTGSYGPTNHQGGADAVWRAPWYRPWRENPWPELLEEKLERLTRLVGTDERFYVLALHSFVEYRLRCENGHGDGPKFAELTWAFRNELLDLLGISVRKAPGFLFRPAGAHDR